jgi:hypothetical protein
MTGEYRFDAVSYMPGAKEILVSGAEHHSASTEQNAHARLSSHPLNIKGASLHVFMQVICIVRI